MNISAINVAQQRVSFKGVERATTQPKPLVTENTPDDAVVAYGTMGPNYVYPITAGHIKAQLATKAAKAEYAQPEGQTKENPEKYYDRKLFSPEWWS